MNKTVLELAFCRCVIETQKEIIKELKHELETAKVYGELQLALRRKSDAERLTTPRYSIN